MLKIKLIKLFSIIILIILSSIKIQSQVFDDVARPSGINHFAFDPMMMSGGVGVIDYNNDGFEDLYYIGGLRPSNLFKNNGDGTFTDVTIEANLNNNNNRSKNGIAIGDINNDGLSDIFIATGSRQPDLLYLNKGDGTFEEISESAGIIQKTFSTSVTFVDINLDGYLDIYVGQFGASPGEPCLPNKLYINQQNNTFLDKTLEYGLEDSGCALAVSFSDYDMDGDLDLFIGNDFGYLHGGNKLLKNNYPETKFEDVSNFSSFNLKINSMGVISGDYDADNDFDYFITNIDSNLFYKNIGDGKFKNVAKEMGLEIGQVPQTDENFKVTATSWGGSFTDFDNDTDFDLAVTNGHVVSPNNFIDYDKYYKNDGKGNLVESSFEVNFNNAERNRGMAVLDYDKDGDMDVAVAHVSVINNSPHRSKLMKNTLPTNDNTNWIQIKLKGVVANRDAYGSKIYVYVKDKIMLRETHGGGDTYLSQHSNFQHYGLGNNKKIDSIVILWNGGGIQAVKNVNANQFIVIEQEFDNTYNVNLCKSETFQGKVIENSQKIVNRINIQNEKDSIVVFNLIVLQPSFYEENLSICEGKNFQNINITKDTTFVLSFKNYLGCDSIYKANISLNPSPKGEKEVSVCFGGEYKGNKYFKETTITEYVKNGILCDSIYSTKISINDAPKFEENINLCYGETYNGQIYFRDTIISENIKINKLCDSVIIKYIAVKEQTKFNEVVYLNSGEQYRGNAYQKDTTLTFVFKTQGKCDSTHYINIRILTSVNDNFPNLTKSELKIYPNPNSGVFNLEFNLEKLNINNISKVNIKILNNIGQVIFNSDFKDNYLYENNKIILNIDLNERQKTKLSKGFYLLELLINNQTYSIKFIID